MSAEKAIYSRLSTATGVSALVSTRVYPDHLPQKPTYPAIAFNRIDTERISAMGSDTGVANATYTIRCIDTSYSGAKDVAAQVLANMQRWSGTEASVTILDSFVVDQDFDFDPDTKTYTIDIDFQVWHRE